MDDAYPASSSSSGGGHLRHQMGHARDWAPPGWYREALPTGGCMLVRSQPVVDLNLLLWRSRGTVMVQRLKDSAEVVCHRVSEEDAHVRRYLFALEHRFSRDLTRAMIL